LKYEHIFHSWCIKYKLYKQGLIKDQHVTYMIIWTSFEC